jgi:hypothetical protein
MATMKKAKSSSKKKTPETKKSGPYQIGMAYLIRTVTHYYTGRLIAVYPQELLLDNAAWVADTGRYSAAFQSGDLCEVEPIVGPCIIGRGAVIDAVQWPNALPRSVK